MTCSHSSQSVLFLQIKGNLETNSLNEEILKLEEEQVVQKNYYESQEKDNIPHCCTK